MTDVGRLFAWGLGRGPQVQDRSLGEVSLDGRHKTWGGSKPDKLKEIQPTHVGAAELPDESAAPMTPSSISSAS